MKNNRRTEDRIDSILVPTDGSKCSDRAAILAGKLARRLPSRIHVVFASETNFAGPWYYYILDEPVTETIQRKGREIADRAAQKLRADGVQEVEVHLKEGHPAEVITRMAEELGADLIVMGTHGRRGLDRFLMGSVAREVANTTSVPLLLVK